MGARGKATIVWGQLQKRSQFNAPAGDHRPDIWYPSPPHRMHRKGIHLCCRKITFPRLPIYANCLIDIELTCIQEIEMGLHWKMSTLLPFVPFLGQMRNLQRSIFRKEGHHGTFPMIDVKQLFWDVFLYQFVWLSLRELYLDTDTFLEGHLDKVLW